MSKFIVICGNPVDGFGYIGPFSSHGQATAWADVNLRGTEWWTSELEELEEEMLKEQDNISIDDINDLPVHEETPW